MQSAIAQLLEGKDLPREEARRVMNTIMSGDGFPLGIVITGSVPNPPATPGTGAGTDPQPGTATAASSRTAGQASRRNTVIISSLQRARTRQFPGARPAVISSLLRYWRDR